MDNDFFSKHLLTIARETYVHILFKKERLYYYKYIRKLRYHVIHLSDRSVDNALGYVDAFEYTQSKRIKNGVFVKPKKMLALACKDVRDVVKSMRRFEGVYGNV